LDETREADLLVHVLDIAHPNFEDHFNVVNDTLKEIGVADKPTMIVFNKIDAYKYVSKDEDDLTPRTRENFTLEELQKSWMSRLNADDVVFISAEKKINIEKLKEMLYERVRQIHITRYPHNDFLFEKYD